MKKWFMVFLACCLNTATAASPLPAEEVFKISLSQPHPDNFQINWKIKPGYFLYKDRIHLSTLSPNLVQGNIQMPPAVVKTDSQNRSFMVYRNSLTLNIPVLPSSPGEALMTLHYQGCSDDGFCYPPQTKQIKLTFSQNLVLSQVEFYIDNDALIESDEAIEQTPAGSAETVFLTHHWSMTFLIFFGFGLLLSFTPCVLPMVPVLSGIIVGHGNNITTRKAFFLSLSYVLSMAVTYALVGAMIALLGSNLQVVMQSPWAIGLFSVLFVLLALSMFGCFELKLPVSWQAGLAHANRSHGSGHYVSAALMGCLSTLILSPCVTAPLIGALSYIAHSGEVILGALSLFFLGLGMGTPLLLIGTSAGRFLPKAGAWMNAVKSLFGVMMLGVAILLLGRIIPGSLSMALWAALLIFSGIYSGALVPSYSHRDKFKQAAGILMLVYGLLVLTGAGMGETDPFRPLAGFSEKASKPANVIEVDGKNVEKTLSEIHNHPVIIDFYADWCTACKIMEATTFQDPDVMAALKKFIIIKANITLNSPDDKALLARYQVIAPPTFLFFNKKGEEIVSMRLVGESSAREFLNHLRKYPD